jgi:hypothetical protein
VLIFGNKTKLGINFSLLKKTRCWLMDFDRFTQSIVTKQMPLALPHTLQALWHDATGNWQTAHNLMQQDEGNLLYDRIHAYLHRKEGDIFNAKYWYRRINVPYPGISLEEEWQILAKEYLASI